MAPSADGYGSSLKSRSLPRHWSALCGGVTRECQKCGETLCKTPPCKGWPGRSTQKPINLGAANVHLGRLHVFEKSSLKGLVDFITLYTKGNFLSVQGIAG